ncbi:MAG TPA: hypothetical protein VF618_21570 [Thermoanaerobaculia bacterium]
MLKHNHLLIVMSLLSIVLLSLHVTDDIVRGYDRWGYDKLSFVLIMVVWLYGTLLLADRRAGQIIMLLGGFLAAAMPAIHMRGTGAFVKSSGAFFFVWTLFAVGTSGALAVILAVRALRSRASVEGDGTMTASPNENPDRRR